MLKKVKKTIKHHPKRITGKKKAPKKTRKLSKPIVLVRSEQNPIISPRPNNEWEAWQTFNPGVILLGNKIHLLYRAIGPDGISRLGYAVSSDGFTIDERLSYPVYEHKTSQRVFCVHSYFSGGSFAGVEDPRPVRVDGEDVLYMSYTACGDGLRIGLTSIKVADFIGRNWKWKTPIYLSPPGEVHKNWVIFPEKINGKYAILHSLNPNIKIEYVDSLDLADSCPIGSGYNPVLRKDCWDGFIRGVCAPPIKTNSGWLIFYHAMDARDFSKYKIGAMLLDLNDPAKIICRSRAPVLEPSEHYENNGFKPGIIYATGTIVKDGTLLIYYGAADSCVCVASAPFEKFLNTLLHGEKIKLSIKPLKMRK